MLNKYFGFTLAEVMITMLVIGIITAIAVPVAINSRPDEKVMKFKKAHNELYEAIDTLVKSDKYYFDGDLGKNMDSDSNDTETFIESLMDVMTVKQSKVNSYYYPYSTCNSDNMIELTDMNTFKQTLDERCKTIKRTQTDIEVCTGDGPVVECGLKSISTPFGIYFNTADNITFFDNGGAFFSHGYEDFYCTYPDAYERNDDGFYFRYKLICIDIDGVDENATNSDCVNECPFGYGIRVDGKIISGARADEWLTRDVYYE